jgi:uridylate kinase
MDLTAVSLCMQSGIEIVVFDMQDSENFRKVVTGEKVGTKIIKGE